MTPNDLDAYVGDPPLGCPQYDEVHISVTFTWDKNKVPQLSKNWSRYGAVLEGGPAYSSQALTNFEPGRYLRKGVTITSRGCPNNCPWCLVPEREGKLKELPIQAGYIVQDNNLLACSKSHIGKVFEMLEHQPRAAVFSGGFEAARLTDSIIENLQNLRIKEVWLSYDSDGSENIVTSAIMRLRRFLTLRQVRCYVLVGYELDTVENAENRLRYVLEHGALPFAMRYRKAAMNWQDTFISTAREWNLLVRKWTRPAIMMTRSNDCRSGVNTPRLCDVW